MIKNQHENSLQSNYSIAHCFQHRKNAFLIQIGVNIVRDNQQMNRSWDAYLAFPACFAEADDIITNLAKERPGIKMTECTA